MLRLQSAHCVVTALPLTTGRERRTNTRPGQYRPLRGLDVYEATQPGVDTPGYAVPPLSGLSIERSVGVVTWFLKNAYILNEWGLN